MAIINTPGGLGYTAESIGFAQQPDGSFRPVRAEFTTVHQDEAEAIGNGIVANVTGYATSTVQIDGITSATVTFEGTVDGTNWVAIVATDRNDGTTSATTATSDGLYVVDVRGLAYLRCRISVYATGKITITSLTIPLA